MFPFNIALIKMNYRYFFLEIKSPLFLKNNIYAFEMPIEESIDIDTEIDFKIAKALIK